MENSSENKTNIKCVIIGDGCVGKTCMLHRYTTNEFPTEHVPTIFNNLAVSVDVDNKEYNMQLFDTAGQEEYDRLRVLTYPDTDIFMITFSVADHVSFHNVESMWVPEIHHMCGKDAKFILVGNKVDLRMDAQKNKDGLVSFVSKDEGAKTANRIGAKFYCECSALTHKGLDDVFENAILAALGHSASGKKRNKGIFSRINCLKGTK